MRSVAGRLSNRMAASVPRPRGTRTTTLRAGGVIPRTNCGFNSSIVATVVSASRARSEEHTSELQSRSDLVCRLLLEKKKNQYKDKFVNLSILITNMLIILMLNSLYQHCDNM